MSDEISPAESVLYLHSLILIFLLGNWFIKFRLFIDFLYNTNF